MLSGLVAVLYLHLLMSSTDIYFASSLRRPAAAAASDAPPARYLPWDSVTKDVADVLVVDCTHSAAQTITHHKGQRNPPAELMASDCSTGLVLDALKAAASGGRAAAAIAPWLVS